MRQAQTSRTLARAIAGAAFAALGACRQDEAPAAKVRPVLVAPVERRTTQVFGPFTGTVEPRYQSDQGFRTSGRMLTRLTEVGDVVHKGERLATLDDTLLKFSVTDAESGVAEAAAQARRTELAVERKRALSKTGAVAQSDVDSADADAKTAAAKLVQAKASLQRTRDQLGYATLTAEYDGVVIKWMAEVGQNVGEGQSVVTIARKDVREAVIDMPDGLVGEVRAKATFDVRLQSDEDLVAQGAVREISPSADSATRTRRVRFTLRAPPEAFRIGSTVSVSLTRPIPPLTLIPEAAIFRRGGTDAVWVVPSKADQAEERTIAVLGRRAGVASVAGPLDPTDQVIVAGVHELQPRQRVRPIVCFP